MISENRSLNICSKFACYNFLISGSLLILIIYSFSIWKQNSTSRFEISPVTILNKFQLFSCFESSERSLKFRELLSNSDGYFTNISDPILVSAYFQLGILIKGDFAGAGTPQFYLPEHYKNWIAPFAFIGNFVSFYSDDRDVLEQFRFHRESNPILANRSHIQLVHRYSNFSSSKNSEWNLFSFVRYRERIATVLSQPGYPRYHPNTFVPEYGCVMHAKYELLVHTALYAHLLFPSSDGDSSDSSALSPANARPRYLAWVDIGYFRELPLPPTSFVASSSSSYPSLLLPFFKLALPPAVAASPGDAVAFTEVGQFSPSATAREVVHGNRVWLAGGFFVGRADTLVRFALHYLLIVERMLERNLSNTDQQVLYAMQLPEGQRYLQRILPTVASVQSSLLRTSLSLSPTQLTQILGSEGTPSSESERTVRALVELLFQLPPSSTPSPLPPLDLSTVELARPVHVVAQSLARDRSTTSGGVRAAASLRPSAASAVAGAGTGGGGERWDWSAWFHLGHLCALLWERERGERVRELVAADGCLANLSHRAATGTVNG